MTTSRMITVKSDQVRCCTLTMMSWIARGRPATIPAKIIRLIPLPIPRSVICSPTHMMNAVPVVRVIITMKRKYQPGASTICGPVPPDFSRATAVMNPWNIVSTTVR